MQRSQFLLTRTANNLSDFDVMKEMPRGVYWI
jgi:hypothetical protein